MRPRNQESVSSGVRVTKLLPELDEVSSLPTIRTTEHMMVFFPVFARFHERGSGYVPYELQTVDCPIVESTECQRSTRVESHSSCVVREIARTQKCDESSWLLITWEESQATMTPCSRLEDAKELPARTAAADCLARLGAVAKRCKGKRRTAFRHPPIALNLHRHAVCSLLSLTARWSNPPQPPYPTDLGAGSRLCPCCGIGVSRRTSASLAASKAASKAASAFG